MLAAVAVALPQYQPFLIFVGIAFGLLALGMLQKGMLTWGNLFNLKGLATLVTFTGLVVFGIKLVLENGFGVVLPMLSGLPIEYMFLMGAGILALAAVEFINNSG